MLRLEKMQAEEEVAQARRYTEVCFQRVGCIRYAKHDGVFDVQTKFDVSACPISHTSLVSAGYAPGTS